MADEAQTDLNEVTETLGRVSICENNPVLAGRRTFLRPPRVPGEAMGPPPPRVPRAGMRPPRVPPRGRATSLSNNFMDVCRMCNLQPEHVMAFVLAELGTSGSLDEQKRLLINGRITQSSFEAALKRYVRTYNIRV